nr:hypothetical protein [Tanacetum cinerariifolium]
DPMLRLCHRLIACSITRRSQDLLGKRVMHEELLRRLQWHQKLDRENSGEYMERLRLPPVTSSYCMRAGIRISGIGMVIGFRTGDRVNRRSGVVMTRRSAGRNGNDRQGQGNYNQRQHRNQSTWDFNQGHASGSSGQRRSTETLPPLPLCATCGKPHPGV